MTRKIAVGNPSKKRASFTRFVLPFAWHKQVERSSSNFPHFRRADANDWIHSAIDGHRVMEQDRCRYFTPEAAELLYHRATWFIFQEKEKATADSSAVWKRFGVESGLKDTDRKYQVALRSPALILFESIGKDTPEQEDPDLLRSGFLVIEAFFPDEAHAPTFEDLLRFNEIFRYWRCPYEKHATEFCNKELNSIYKGIFGSGTGDDQEKNLQRLYAQQWAELFRHAIKDGQKKPFFVMPQEWLSKDENDSGVYRQRNGDPRWLIQPDDRAFTVACVFLDGDLPTNNSPQGALTQRWADVVASGFEGATSQVANSPLPSLSGHWVKILNIDRPFWPKDDGSCSRFEYLWAAERTYRRWAHDGSLYGFTPHSMALMAGVKKLNCDLRLMSVTEESHIPDEGKGLMIVAQVNQRLYFSIFDDKGKSVLVDKAGKSVKRKSEADIEPALSEELNTLKSKLDGLWEARGLTQDQKNEIIAAVASIIDPHGEPPLARHCGSLYFDASLLLLYVRASLFRFSNRLHEVSAEVRNNQIPESSPDWKDWASKFAKIRWQFLQFENLYQFPLLSNQQQHLEMYEIQRRCMDIQELYKEIDKEVQSSDHVLNNKLDNQRNQFTEALNVVAAVGLGLSVGLACYQIEGFHKWTEGFWAKLPPILRATSPPVVWSLLWVILFLFLLLLLSISRMPDKLRVTRSSRSPNQL